VANASHPSSDPRQTKQDFGRIADFVSFSAELMAAIRVWESDRPQALFKDPFARQFVSPFALQLVAEREQQQDGLLDLLALRTRFFDDFLLAATAEVKQVVILAAGLDARAFRLPLSSGIQLYELDQAQVIAGKQRLLGDAVPCCHRHAIAADLTQPWLPKLLESGYQPTAPSAWMMEGLLMYLTEGEVRELLQTLWQAAAPGSWCAADLLNPAALESDDPAAPYWRSGFDVPEEIFTAIGWQIADVIQPQDFGLKFNRPTYPVPPREVPGVPRSFWITAKKP
jgi:methyltransferase (TIGR00027 family)